MGSRMPKAASHLAGLGRGGRARSGQDLWAGLVGQGMAEWCKRGISVTVLEENDRPLEFRHAIWLREAGACLILRRQWVGTGPGKGRYETPQLWTQ